ncbi:hypothetical protein HAX54_051898 [Datura stramonium]|uniref:Flavin-containing monooxygenase n=1 Tax=Datura stramonium TaxID=4076 RepID=A0ABS8SY89_DATST|nr:hypothetical protein [Datura stramonium]
MATNERGEKQVIGIIGGGVSGLLGANTTFKFDPFSDFPWPDSVAEVFPDQQTVLDYIESYAHHFDLIRHIHFNTKVLSLSYEDGGGAGEWDLWSDPFNNKGKWNTSP